MTLDTPLLPLAFLTVYLLRLSQRVKNNTTAMGNYISSMMKKGMRYGESSNGANQKHIPIHLDHCLEKWI